MEGVYCTIVLGVEV